MTEPFLKQRIYDVYAKATFPEWQSHDTAHYERWSRSARFRFRHWLPNSARAHCLDLGCGAGHFLYFLRNLGYSNITGVDMCEEAVQTALRLGLKVVHGNLLDFIYTDKQKYDLISAIDVIEHLTRPEIYSLFEAVADKLRPEGSFLIQTVNANSPWFGAYRYGDLTHELAFTSRNLGQLLVSAGFTNSQFRDSSPPPNTTTGALRWCVWKAIASLYSAWNIVETGSTQDGIYSRVIVARAFRK